MFRPVLPQLITFISEMMGNASLEDATRQTALELILTLSEMAPGMFRKQPRFAQTIIPIVLDWMCDLEDDPEWYTTEDIDDDDNDMNYVVGEQSMDRIARSLGGSIVLPESFKIIPGLLSSPEWNKRHGGLRAISAIGEGCDKIIRAELEKVVNVVVPHLQDPHPRVRHAACNAIGQMCTDFSVNSFLYFVFY